MRLQILDCIHTGHSGITKCWSTELYDAETQSTAGSTQETCKKVGETEDIAVMTWETQHPTLLPYEHTISLLIARHTHQQGHSGFASTTAKIRTRFWILKAMKLVKSIKSKCTFSREMTQRVETQLMVDLPWLRLLPFTALFQVSTCDYFGPLKVKIGKNKTLHSKIHMLEYQCCSSWEGCRLLPVSKFVMNDNSLCKF